MVENKIKNKALILLQDGTIFFGKALGVSGTAFGELCFNTGMTGYQEIFTDPSYFGQLMVTTNAHIGNYGVNEHEVESGAQKSTMTGFVFELSTTSFMNVSSFTFMILLAFEIKSLFSID